MEKKKSKKELLKEAQEIADILDEKKDVIKTALDDLDKKVKKEGISEDILSGMALIEELFTEYDEIHLEQLKIFEKIKG